MGLIKQYDRNGIQHSNRRGKMKADFFPIFNNFSLSEAARLEHFTFTFVRHPFSRIVSGYTNKLDHNWSEVSKDAEFSDVRDQIAIIAGIQRDK